MFDLGHAVEMKFSMSANIYRWGGSITNPSGSVTFYEGLLGVGSGESFPAYRAAESADGSLHLVDPTVTVWLAHHIHFQAVW